MIRCCNAILLITISLLSPLLAQADQTAKVYDTEVGPWKLEAEDFVWSHNATVFDDPAASGGRGVKRPGYKFILLNEMPFPRTSKPVTIYVRVWPAVPNEQYLLMATDAQGERRTLSRLTTKADQVGRWQWIKFDPLMADAVGNCFDIEFTRDLFGDSTLDCVVISTQGDLDDKQLEAAPPLFNNGPVSGTPPSVGASGISTASASSTGPLTVVARASSPPVIDGKVDDECWASAVACSGFQRIETMQSAEADTTVRLLYDDQNLYIQFTCPESTLDILGQRRHEFAANVEQRDGPVEEDDVAVMLLDPDNTGAQAFEWVVNARGTIADARGSAPDFKATRDLSWNSTAQSAGDMGDGRWTVEIVVPFKDIGKSPRVGDVWKIALGRISHSRDEATSWNPSNASIQQPITFGTLVFDQSTGGVALNAPTSLQIGKNELSTVLQSNETGPRGFYLTVHLTSPEAKLRKNFYEFVEPADASGRVTRSFELADEARQQIVYGVLDAATLRPLYMSPVLSRVPRSALAQVTLATEGPFQLYLNGEIIGKGDISPEKPIAAPLQKGANTFALVLENGTAAIQVSTPQGDTFSAESWNIAPADAATATVPMLDDHSWPIAPKVGDHATLGAIVGQAGKKVTLRRTLLGESTRIWPTPQPAFYLAQGPAAQHFNVVLAGIEGRPLDGWTTYLATPPEFEIIGSSGFYANHFRCTPLGEREVRGQTMRVVKVQADSPVLSGQHYIYSMFNAFLRYREDADRPASLDHTFYYWSEANGGSVSEPPQAFAVRLLPKLDGRQPAKSFWELWGGWESNMNDPAMREEIYRCAQLAGFNRFHGGFERQFRDIALRYNLKSDGVVDFNPWNLDLASWLDAHPEQRLITATGQPAKRGSGVAPNRDLMCTSLLLGKGWPGVEAELKKLIDRTGAHMLNYDYEYPPWDGPHSCYCDRCLGAFRQHAKLDANTALTATVIRESYADQWADFMTLRMAQVCLAFKQGIKKLAPDVQFSIYSGYQTPDVRETEGIDWRYVGQLQACDMAVCGYGRPVDATRATIKALQGIPLAGGVIVYPYNTWETRPAVAVTKANVLRTMLDCRGGVMFYDRLPMDGRCWQAIAEVSRLVAGHEDLFISGNTGELADLDPRIVQSVTDGKTTIVCAMNMEDKPMVQTIRLPRDAGGGREFYTNAKVSAGQTIEINLDPGEIAVWVMEK